MHDIEDPFLAKLAHDGGHALIAASVAAALMLFDVPKLLAVAIGCLGMAFLQELKDFLKDKRLSRDSIHDVATYQPLWILYMLQAGEYLQATVVAILIAIVVGLFYYNEFQERKKVKVA